MYGIYDGNIYHQYTPNVRIYTSTMDPMGYKMISILTHIVCCSGSNQVKLPVVFPCAMIPFVGFSKHRHRQISRSFPPVGCWDTACRLPNGYVSIMYIMYDISWSMISSYSGFLDSSRYNVVPSCAQNVHSYARPFEMKISYSSHKKSRLTRWRSW